MPIGISLQLFNGSTPQANLSGIQALWWDVAELKDTGIPVGKTTVATTDSNGYISLDLSDVSGLSVGGYGFLSLYKIGTGDLTDSLIFSGRVQTSTIASGLTMRDPGRPINTWVRNPSWLALPTIGTSDQKFCGLMAIYPSSSNYVALSASGAYTVDWGDGVVENFATGVQANHLYSYSAGPLANTNIPVTINATTDTINRNSHGYVNGNQVSFYNIVTTTDLISGVSYYVVNASTNSFQVSTTLGGAAVSIGLDGTANLLEHKQAIVTVTPQGGQTLTALNLNLKHTATNLQVYATTWLDVVMGSPNFSASGLTISASSQAVRHEYLEKVVIINSGNLTTMSSLFSNIGLLKYVELDTVGVTNMSSMFNGCRNLEEVPLFDTSSVTTMISMFSGCTSLKSIPLFNTASVTLVTSMFTSCSSLETIPLLNTGSVTSLASMFNVCTNLKTIPLLNTSAATSLSNMFASCKNLSYVPPLNCVSCLDLSSMFTACTRLEFASLVNTGAATNVSNMFSGCSMLKGASVSPSAATVLTSMFSGCSMLKDAPTMNTDAATVMNGMFTSCTALETVPLYNTALVTNMSNMFNGCSRLTRVPLFNTVSVQNMSNMFTSCSSLETVPAFNTVAVTDMSSMFMTCWSLKTIPLMNTTAVTTVDSMFSGCRSLHTVPALVLSSVTAAGSFFNSCTSLSDIKITGLGMTFSVATCKLGSAELDALYTALPTVSGKVITVTNNVGTVADTPSIATAKGWTVTG